VPVKELINKTVNEPADKRMHRLLQVAR